MAASSDRLLICGDFNINWLDTSDNICKKLLNTLESYNLHQHVTNSIHKSGHLLDYIISDNQLVSSVLASDFISDHCALHATIACTRDHPSRKKITYRCLKNIKFDELSNDLSNIDFKMECIDVNLVADNYNTVFRGVPRIWQGGGQEFFFSDLEICMSRSDMLRMAKPCALLGGFGGMPTRGIFLKWCNLVRFGVYFDQILSLKNFKNYHFLYKKFKNCNFFI